MRVSRLAVLIAGRFNEVICPIDGDGGTVDNVGVLKAHEQVSVLKREMARHNLNESIKIGCSN